MLPNYFAVQKRGSRLHQTRVTRFVWTCWQLFDRKSCSNSCGGIVPVEFLLFASASRVSWNLGLKWVAWNWTTPDLGFSFAKLATECWTSSRGLDFCWCPDQWIPCISGKDWALRGLFWPREIHNQGKNGHFQCLMPVSSSQDYWVQWSVQESGSFKKVTWSALSNY